MSTRPVGELLREWRQRRRLTQMDLAGDADISTRHLSFIETGRATPSRDMVLHLANRLEVPLREQNHLLLAAGFAPVFTERPIDDSAFGAVRNAMDLILRGHEPYPALAVNRHWSLVTANRAAQRFLSGVDETLLQPPVNVLRLSLHPRGVASRIANLTEWRSHVLERLRRQVEATADPILADLFEELRSYPAPDPGGTSPHREYDGVVVPLKLRTDSVVLSFFSTTTVFGTPTDVTVSELALESFFPADEATAEALRQMAKLEQEPAGF